MMKLILTLLLVFFSCTIESQNSKDSLVLAKMDEWFNVSKGKYDSLAFVNSHKILDVAKKISNVAWEAESYKLLAWYHGHGHVKKRDLDSTLYYFNLFESKMPKLLLANNKKKVAEHFLNKGNILANRFGLPEEGLKAFNRGYEYIDSKNLNLQTYYDIFIAQIYRFKNQIDQSIDVLSPRIKDTASLDIPYKLYLMQNLAFSYKENKDPKKSFPLNKKILEIARRQNNEYYIWWTRNEMCYDYYLLGDTQKAIDSALFVRDYYIKNLNVDALIVNSGNLGDFYYKIGNLDKAIIYREDALEREYSINDLPLKYGKLANLYSEIKEYEKAKYYYSKKDELNDSLRLREQALYISYANANVKFLKEKKLNDEIKSNNEILQTKNKKQKNYIVMLSLFLLCLSFFVVLYYLLKKDTKNEQKNLETLNVDEKNLLEEQIKLRDEELEVSAKTLSSNISLLNEIKRELDKGESTSKEKIRKTSNEIKKVIESASNIAVLREKLTSKNSRLTLLLKERHPDLSEREIEYCLLTKLNFSIKETASILNVSPGTVKVARSRLKTRMNIPPEVSFKEYLNSIME